MLRYWDYELDPVDWPRPVVSEKLAQMRCSWQQRTEQRLGAEPNIIRNFIKRIENTSEPDCTVRNYWDTVKQRLITLSAAEAGEYWIKYEGRYDEASRMGHYKDVGDDVTKCRCYNWNFGQWLALYTGTMQYDASYERFQQEPSDIKI